MNASSVSPFAGSCTVKTKGRAADAAYDVHKVCYIVPYKEDVIDLLAKIQCCHQKHRDGNAARKACQRRKHDQHKDNAGCTQQSIVGKQDTL